MAATKRAWKCKACGQMNTGWASDCGRCGNGKGASSEGISRAGYMKGRKIFSLIDFISLLEVGQPFYFNHKFMAAGFIEHWSVIQIRNAIKYNRLRTADKVK